MTPLQIIQLIKARRKLFARILGTLLAVVLLVSLIIPKTYVAETSVVVDSKGTDTLTGAPQPAQLLPSNLATQLDIIGSHNVALKVVDKLRLPTVPELRDQFEWSTGGTGSIRDWLADNLLINLDVKPSRESNVISIGFAGRNPNFAATVANAFAEAYIQTSLELRVDPARRQAVWFNQQLLELRRNVELAQRRLSDAQKKENIVGTDDHLDIENAKLAEITDQLVNAQASMYDAQTRLNQMSDALKHKRVEELPDILGNTLLQNMKADLVRLESQLAEAASRYGRNHPQHVSLAAQTQALRKRFATELHTAEGSITQAAELAGRRTAQLQAAQDAQKARILELKRQHDSLDVLNREVENAQRVYDATAQRAGEVHLESQMDQSNIAVLNAAVPPLKAARPKVLLNLVLALVLGSLASFCAIFCAELLNRRVRSGDDLMARGIFVLTEIPPLLETTRRMPRVLSEGWQRLTQGRRLATDCRESDI
jgi:succinoglycan biosynthesis transport protein ExoP